MSADLVKPNGALHDRMAFWLGIGLLVVALAAALALRVMGIDAFGWTPSCKFHDTTGLYCLGCGGTRSLASLAQGSWRQALGQNVLAIGVFIPLYLALAINLIVYGKRGRYLWRWRVTKWQILALVALALLFMVARNLPWYPFTLLAP